MLHAFVFVSLLTGEMPSPVQLNQLTPSQWKQYRHAYTCEIYHYLYPVISSTDKATNQTGRWPWCAIIWWYLSRWRWWGRRWLWKWEWWRLGAVWEAKEIWWSTYWTERKNSTEINLNSVNGTLKNVCYVIAGGSWEENWKTASKAGVGGTKVKCLRGSGSCLLLDCYHF